ncbi:hypothetical protein HQ865_21455 [Mucilaginibacter mali]|uniref:Uncharacterized protein n=1 Tax=Mucilaginibacter mali TaxID=2740462 RepID=A0A7D4UD26_9SPHI|nr:hypothetical protein [Mucilaginibacter mali]QKJ32218.1 hypothetical protein HQ865_21455 [Mucilaginibacter mali]
MLKSTPNATKKPQIFRLEAFKLDEVVPTGQRSNFFADLQAIENAEEFMELAINRIKFTTSDDTKRFAKRVDLKKNGTV